jgi:hypothetical protein
MLDRAGSQPSVEDGSSSETISYGTFNADIEIALASSTFAAREMGLQTNLAGIIPRRRKFVNNNAQFVI